MSNVVSLRIDAYMYIYGLFYFILEHTCTRVTAEMTGPRCSTRFGSNKPGSVTWLANEYFKNPYRQLEKSHWKNNYTGSTECNLGLKWIFHFSYFDIFMLNCVKKTSKLKFDSCQTWMHQNILHPVALKPLASAWELEWNAVKILTYMKKTQFTCFLDW